MGYAESVALPVLEKAFSVSLRLQYEGTNERTNLLPLLPLFSLFSLFSPFSLFSHHHPALHPPHAHTQDLDIPDLNFNVNAGICTVHASVKNVKCADLKISSLTLTPKASEGVTLAGSGLGVSCHADWSYKCGILKGSGSVDAAVGGSTALNAELGVTSPAPAFATQAALLQCQPKIDISSLSFHGGISGSILNLFKSELKKTLSSEIEKEMCSELMDVVKKQLNSLLAQEPFSEVSCEVLDGAVVCDSNVAVGDLSGVTPPALPAPSASILASHMVEIAVTEFPLNYALGFVHDMGM